MFLILKDWYNKKELKCILVLKNICPAANCTLISHLQAALLSHVTMSNSDSSATQTSKRGLPWIPSQKAPLQHLLQLQPFPSGENPTSTTQSMGRGLDEAHRRAPQSFFCSYLFYRVLFQDRGALVLPELLLRKTAMVTTLPLRH